MIISLWLPIIVSILAMLIFIFVPLPFSWKGILVIAALGIWLLYFINLTLEKAVTDILIGNPASILMILAILFVAILYWRNK